MASAPKCEADDDCAKDCPAGYVCDCQSGACAAHEPVPVCSVDPDCAATCPAAQTCICEAGACLSGPAAVVGVCEDEVSCVLVCPSGVCRCQGGQCLQFGGDSAQCQADADCAAACPIHSTCPCINTACLVVAGHPQLGDFTSALPCGRVGVASTQPRVRPRLGRGQGGRFDEFRAGFR